VSIGKLLSFRGIAVDDIEKRIAVDDIEKRGSVF